MTTQQLILAFKFGMDKFDSKGLPNFEDDEILLLLNQAQLNFVKQRYGSNNSKKMGFEEIQKRTEDLKNLVRNAILIPNANIAENISVNAQFVDLPSDYLVAVQERCKITYNDCTGKPTQDECFVKVIQHNDYNTNINNPYSGPNTGKILRLMENGRIELIHSSDTTINEYRLRYIKYPNDITLDNTSELSPETHQEIVNEAIKIGLEGIESKRLQTFIPTILTQQE
jgi:hypothetical protein